jgi:hypothetical protein
VLVLLGAFEKQPKQTRGRRRVVVVLSDMANLDV